METTIPEGERRRIESENPLNVDPNAALIVNRKDACRFRRDILRL